MLRKLRHVALRVLLVLAGLAAGILLKLASLPSLASTGRQTVAAVSPPKIAPVAGSPSPAPDSASATQPGVSEPLDALALAKLPGDELLPELVKVIHRFTAGDIAAFLQAWGRTGAGQSFQSKAERDCWLLLATRWDAVDSPGLLSWMTERGRSGHTWELECLLQPPFTAFLRRNPRAAAEWMLKEKLVGMFGDYVLYQCAQLSKEDRLELGVLLAKADFKALAAADPLGAARHLASVVSGQPSINDSVSTLARLWGARDRPAAMDWAGKLPPQQRRVALLELVQAGDGAGLAEALEMLQPGEDRRFLTGMSIKKLAKTDPEAAIAMAKTSLTGHHRDDAIANILLRKMESDPEGTKARLRAMGWPGYSYTVLLDQTDTDPAGAFAEVAKSGWGEIGYQMGQKLTDWAKSSPQAALDWANQAPERLRQEALKNVIQSFKEKSAVEADAFLQTLPPGEARMKLLDVVVGKQAKESPAQALANLRQAPPAEQAGLAAKYLADLWKNPESRSGLLQTLAATPATEETRKAAVGSLVKLPPAESVAALASLPPNIADPKAWGSVSAAWAAVSPPETSVWAQTLPPGPNKDQVISSMLQGISDDGDPAAAWEWAAVIQGDATRGQARQTAARNWLAEDPEAAREAISQDTRLTDAEKTSLLQPFTTPARSQP